MSGRNVTRKHYSFAVEPMGEKPVTALAGVGRELGSRLRAAGYDKAYHVFGVYLLLEKDEESFKRWMSETCSANSRQSADCWRCLNDWCRELFH